jgi:hypothetical protein
MSYIGTRLILASIQGPKGTAVVSYKSPNAKNCGANMGRFIYNTFVFRNPYCDPQPAMQNQLSFLKVITDDR